MAQLQKKTLLETFKMKRGWGHEVWIENNEKYCGKLLIIDQGKKGSLHFHGEKSETMYLIKGKVDLRFVDPKPGDEYVVHLEPGDSIFIPKNQVHQIIGLEDSTIAEFSTPHDENDSYRVQRGD